MQGEQCTGAAYLFAHVVKGTRHTGSGGFAKDIFHTHCCGIAEDCRLQRLSGYYAFREGHPRRQHYLETPIGYQHLQKRLEKESGAARIYSSCHASSFTSIDKSGHVWSRNGDGRSKVEDLKFFGETFAERFCHVRELTPEIPATYA